MIFFNNNNNNNKLISLIKLQMVLQISTGF